MNIYLIPYTFMRHVVMALGLAAAGLLAWWFALLCVIEGVPFFYETFGVLWPQTFEGTLYLGVLMMVVAFGSVFLEGSLRRRAMGWRLFYAALGAGIALFGLWIGRGMYGLLLPLFTGDETDKLLEDASLVTLRYRLAAWLMAGFWSGVGLFLARRLHAVITRRWTWGGRDTEPPAPAPTWGEWASMLFAHVGGGVVAGAFAAAAWHVPGHYPALAGDLYLSAAGAAMTFGGLHGLLCWPIPDDLYAGWIRVLSAERYGLRIPVPHTDGSPAERFVGHFPRGLDLYLPADRGVAELHASFVVDQRHRYAVRGLSVQPTVVKRPLERIDLRYDVRRPAPLETTLRMEDRVLLGEQGETVIEFLMLPREER